MTTLFLFISAIIPGVFLARYFYKKDSFQPEPWNLVKKTFYWGALSIFPASVIQLQFDIEPSPENFMANLIFFTGVVALTEEAAKLAVIYFIPGKTTFFDEPMDGLVYGAAAAAGFATLENVFYVFDHGFAVAIIRAVLSVPSHIFEGAILGYGISRARFMNISPKSAYFKAFFIVLIFHGLFDVCANMTQAFPIMFLGLPIIVYSQWRIVKSYITEALDISRAEFSPDSEVVDAEYIYDNTKLPTPPKTPVKILLRLFGIVFLCLGLFLLLGAFALYEDGEMEFLHIVVSLVPLLISRYLMNKVKN